MNRDNCFDFLRCLFASIVLIAHIIAISSLAELQPLLPYFDTYISVTGFFIISGFLITQSFLRSDSLKLYFLKRGKRLLPAYWFVVIGCAFGLSLVSTLPWEQYFFSKDWIAYLAANLSFLNFIHPSLPGVFESNLVNDASVNPALWTLKIEVAFYIVLPLLLWLLKRSKHAWLWLVGIYVISVLYRNGLHYVAEISGKHIYTIMARQLPGFMSYFAVGMGICLYKDRFLTLKNKLLFPAVLIYLLERCFDLEWLTPLCFGILVVWCAYSLVFLNNFARFGDISYGVYIYHGPLIKLALTSGLFIALGTWLAMLLVVVLVIMVAFLSWHFLEKPILKR